MLPQESSSHPGISFNPPSCSGNNSGLNSGPSGTMMSAAAAAGAVSSTPPAVTDISPCDPETRPVSGTIMSHTAVVSSVASVAAASVKTCRPLITTSTGAANVAVVRRRTSDKSHLLIAVGQYRLKRRLHMRCAMRGEWKYSLEIAVSRWHSPCIAAHHNASWSAAQCVWKCCLRLCDSYCHCSTIV